MPTPPAHPRAFTLLELVTAIAVTGILAATAIPAFRTLAATREGAAASELRRQLLTVRSTALACGRPTGLEVSPAGTLRPLQIVTVGAPPSTLTGPGGTAEPTLSLPGRFPGVAIASVRLGSGESGAATFWFAFDGTPQTRASSGVLQPAWSADGEVRFSGGSAVTVRRVTGLIE